MAAPNRALFESVVRLLVPVLDELVFVGGCTDVREYIGSGIQALLDNPDFTEALGGFLLPDAASQARRGLLGRTAQAPCAVSPSRALLSAWTGTGKIPRRMRVLQAGGIAVRRAAYA